MFLYTRKMETIRWDALRKRQLHGLRKMFMYIASFLTSQRSERVTHDDNCKWLVKQKEKEQACG